MLKIKNTSDSQLYTIVIPLAIVIASCSLILVNFFTIKILSASRAYVNGESHYSKAERMQQDTLLLICLLKIYKTGLHLKRNKSAAWGSCRKNLTTQQSLDGRSKKKVSSQAGTTRKI
jgi:hypothetical protein